jgi:hypothetical protein
VIFPENACIVIDSDGHPGEVYLEWCDEADAEAIRVRGYVAQLDSEPLHIFADFRDHETTADPGGHPVTECSMARCGMPDAEAVAEMRRMTARLLREVAGE